MNDLIDLDANATTPLLPAARDAMFALGDLGNPASSHSLGRKARKHLEDARERIADLLGAHPDELIFTSGATEANNLALLGTADISDDVLTSPIEHPSVVEPLKQYISQGAYVRYMSVSPDGRTLLSPWPSTVKHATLQLVNHETGAIQPVREIAQALAPAIPLHTDAAQAVGKIPVNFRELRVTSLAASAHKFRGPVGIGVLLLQRGTPLRPRLFGGHQQQSRRPGTESAMLAVGMAVALEHAVNHLQQHHTKLTQLRDRFISVIQSQCSPVVQNGSSHGFPGTINVSFPGCRGDLLMMALDLAGVACSTGSACSSGSLLPSPVLTAMGVPDEVLRSAIRFSFGPDLSLETIDEAARRVGIAVSRIRGS